MGSLTHDHSGERGSSSFNLKPYFPAIISFIMLLIGIVIDYSGSFTWFEGWLRLGWYSLAYIPVGLPVVKQGLKLILKGDVFTEFFLMSIATIGAFILGEYPEGVAVMLFYAVGELFQSAAVKKAKSNITALLDLQSRTASVLRDGDYQTVHPETVLVGEKIQVRVGEKIPLDSVLLSEKAVLNTAAITGESKPDTVKQAEKVYAGSINLDAVIQLEVVREYKDSSIARILNMVQHATTRKSKTELFIRKFARIYTPVVTFLAIGLTFLPYFFVEDYNFQQWFYRALIFLVISCPCALVISIPLGYFGGLGAASANGLLFKGASFLDKITKVNTLVLDKTGTITKGVFKIKEIQTTSMTEDELMRYVLAIEEQSTHPIAKALLEYKTKEAIYEATGVSEIAGKGLKGQVNGKEVLLGNRALMESYSISLPEATKAIVETVVFAAVENNFAGYIVVADELKDNIKEGIRDIRKAGIKEVVMLSGDKQAITTRVGEELGLEGAIGGLMPEDKLRHVEDIKKDSSRVVAFIGDGINDAPVLAVSDIGIAMGDLGSDVAIETADVILQNGQPAKIAKAMTIGRSTRNIVWQNIGLAFGIKLIVLILGAGGLATMWEAVFADVGVALLAILNAVRLQKMYIG
ncbi:cadmium-translocating P-type ATPase [Leptobacterium flavescens]|uniref:P-type Zn(2+) transporter n=1 Tax=Leptobacterium flavescens TaxID=472055 RepID=A0A6P0UGS0_9FLAO|nr:heavy metal translocating P-type ATPase [Leptobacterium flavescens]NER11832.1 cadmium-translocating P-type ATPase [Leptobacterium flavescens]